MLVIENMISLPDASAMKESISGGGGVANRLDLTGVVWIPMIPQQEAAHDNKKPS